MNRIIRRKQLVAALPLGEPTGFDLLRGKRVLVTGVCGTVGRRLATRLLKDCELGAFVGLDHNESELAFLEDQHRDRANCTFLLADMRDYGALSREMRRVDVVFHAAAYKHVHVCERSPLEAIQTNILGTQNVIQAAMDCSVSRLIFTSSDKAVNPTNVMGASKLMGERLITAAAAIAHRSGAIMISTRFGNVMGSRGSVVPVFYDQIRRGGPVTVTDPDMTRFIMSLDEAVDLIIESLALGKPGDVLIAKMAAVRIGDLAEVLVRHYAPMFGCRARDIEIKVVGPKPGEKFFEELMNEEETRRAVELERHYVVRPTSTVHVETAEANYRGRIAADVIRPYNSANATPLTKSELHRFLVRTRLVHDERRESSRELFGAA